MEKPMSEELPVEEIPSEVVTDQNLSESETEAIVEETTNEADPPTESEEVVEKPSQKKFDKRIAKLTKQVGEQQARAEHFERQLREVQPQPEVKPDGILLEDFDYDVEKWGEAKAKAAEEGALNRYQQEQQTNTQNQNVRTLVGNWEAKTSKAEDKYDDFDEIVGEVKPNNPVSIAIMQAENGDEIAYYLGNNPEAFGRLSDLAQRDVISAITEIGRIGFELQSKPKSAKAPSSAPAPITPVKGGAVASKSPDDMDYDEFSEHRRKVIAARR